MNHTKTMRNHYKVTEIEFDFDYEVLTEDEKKDIVDDVKEGLWTSPTEEDLSDTITDNTGWCIKSLKYLII